MPVFESLSTGVCGGNGRGNSLKERLAYSISIIGTTSFTLAIETQGHIAGSASALLGVLPFVLGSITAPLVGIAGAYTGVPMGVIIFSSSFLAFLSYFVLVRKASLGIQLSNDQCTVKKPSI